MTGKCVSQADSSRIDLLRLFLDETARAIGVTPARLASQGFHVVLGRDQKQEIPKGPFVS